jgi:hypothetical protein
MAVAQLLHVQLCTSGCKKWSLLAKISGLDGMIIPYLCNAA